MPHPITVQSLDDDGIHQLKQSVTSDLLGEKFSHEAFPKIVFRWVPAQSVEDWQAVIKAPSTLELEKLGLLAREVRSDSLHSVQNLILEQKKFAWGPIPQLNVPWERRVAIAIRWVQINLKLMEDDLCLSDAHLRNWMFDDLMNPVWVDFGSVKPMSLGYEGLREFREANLNPVELGARFPFFLTTTFGNRVTAFQRRSLAFPIIRSLPNPLKRVLKGYDLLFRGISSTGRISPRLATAYRKVLLLSFQRRLKRLARKEIHTGFWSKYRKAGVLVADDVSDQPRVRAIRDLVTNLQPAQILDVGANDGFMLIKCSQPGSLHWAYDPDHGSLGKFTRKLSSGELPKGRLFRACVGSLGEIENDADVVLALALTHHLVLTQRYSFEKVAEELSKLTKRCLIVEFMPYGVTKASRGRPQPNLPDWYTLDSFIDALERHFASVELVDYAGQPAVGRQLLLCSKVARSEIDEKELPGGTET